MPRKKKGPTLDVGDLSQIPDEALSAEIERRKTLPPRLRPKPLAECNFSKLHALVVRGFQEAVRANGYVDDDLRSYIYTEAAEAVFGHDFWEKTRHYWK